MSIEITEVPADGHFRRFELVRQEDVSGVSGTGVVAHGVQFPDGTVVLRWSVGEHQSTVNWANIEAVVAIHGHDGRTVVEWIDDPLGMSASDHEFDRMLGSVLDGHTKQVIRDLRELANDWVAGRAHAPQRADAGDLVLAILNSDIPDV